MSPDRSSVLVVDDHELIALSMRSALRAKGITAERSGVGHQAVLAAAAAHRPRLVLLDLDLGRDEHGSPRRGLDLIEPLRNLGCLVAVLTATQREEQIAEAVARGASTWLSKTRPVAEILDAVLAVLAGERILIGAERRELLARHENYLRTRAAADELLRSLTARERVVLDQLIAGKQAAAIAADLVVSLSTVRTQIRSILSKLGVRSQLEAVALVRGLVSE
jgi:DNA-binding NarL/FixJ family response regulator